MKNLKVWIIGAVAGLTVVVGPVLLVSAAGNGEAEKEAELREAHTRLELCQEQLDNLEKEIDDLKETQYLTEQAYKDKIEQLEEELKNEKPVLKPTDESDARYTYTVNGDTVTITGYTGTDKKLTVPSEIDGLAVVAVGREAFKGKSFTEVVLPHSLKTIDWFAFSSCASLNKIHIPAGVTKIEYGVFDGVKNIVVVCPKNSYAHRYAKSYGFSVETE